MQELLRIAANVGTPVSLLGLVVALGYLAYTRRLEYQRRTLQTLPPEQRATAADEYLTRYGIDGKELQPADKLALIREELQKRHRRSLGYVIAATAAFVVCFAIATFGLAENSDDLSEAFRTATGTITEPADRGIVKRTFETSGTARNVGKGVHLWLAVEINDRIWPKEGRLLVNGTGQWRVTVFEDGRPDQFGLSLWSANSSADTQLRAWLDRGANTGAFPELQPPPGMKRLARVEGLRVASAP